MFGYKCQECHEGTVRETAVNGYQTRFDRVPFTVPEAIIGICDKCGAEHHNAGEYKRWRALFEAESQKSGRLLSAQEITALRKRLGLSKSDFAALLGTTRQSVYWWEREDRDRPQSLAYDNMLRLVKVSAERRSVDVVAYLAQRAAEAGIHIGLGAEDVDDIPLADDADEAGPCRVDDDADDTAPEALTDDRTEASVMGTDELETILRSVRQIGNLSGAAAEELARLLGRRREVG